MSVNKPLGPVVHCVRALTDCGFRCWPLLNNKSSQLSFLAERTERDTAHSFFVEESCDLSVQIEDTVGESTPEDVRSYHRDSFVRLVCWVGGTSRDQPAVISCIPVKIPEASRRKGPNTTS